MWPKLRVELDTKILELKLKLMAEAEDVKNANHENYILDLMEAVDFSDEEWYLLINCAMIGKMSVKKELGDE